MLAHESRNPPAIRIQPAREEVFAIHVHHREDDENHLCRGLSLRLLDTRCSTPGRGIFRARRAQCTNNLKQIALALHNYHAAYDALPPAYIADEHGRPLHSWRVLLLPFLKQQSLYEQYDFREPWNGPNNIKLLSKMPSLFECPSSHPPGPAVSTFTSYVVISGPGTMFPGAKPIRFDRVTDILADSMVVEAPTCRQSPGPSPKTWIWGRWVCTSTIGITRASRAIIQAEPMPRWATRLGVSWTNRSRRSG